MNEPADASAPHEPSRSRRRVLILAALGVVYGDIGTSPIYTVREAVAAAAHGVALDQAVLGVVSLVFWALVLVVTLKYVTVILRADNRGEGGVLSLTALAMRGARPGRRWRPVILVLSLIGLSLFGGDGLITPAISVLSAVEGLQVVTPVFEPYVVPIAIGILIGLFLLQPRGTARVGRLFGPIVCLWFVTLGVLGVFEIVREPAILRALNPMHGLQLLGSGNGRALAILGSVVLAVTGAEALYADMGHFGRFPIRAAWLGLVLPGLALNYFGQGALILSEPAAAANPFFLQVPRWGLVPLVLLTTLATIIASQAVISGGFSLTRQAVQLGYLPRLTILHTSASQIGQIYMPRVNWFMMLGVVTLVIGFGSSSDMAGAYGLAVMGTEAVTTILASMVALWLWQWRRVFVVLVFGAFLVVDLGFLGSTLLKVPSGGWFPLACAAAGCIVMWTWMRGRSLLEHAIYRSALPLATFLERLGPSSVRVVGTAVFMTRNFQTVPHALLHNLKHNKVLHERVVLLNVQTEDVPRLPDLQRIEVERLGKGFITVMLRYGFMERPHVPAALELCQKHGLAFDLMQTSFFLGRETLVPAARAAMPYWQSQLFIAMQANAMSATAFFALPPGRVVEMGTQVEI